MAIQKPFNLMKWIDDNADQFQPPVMNNQFYEAAEDVIVFVSKGPNTRNDYHVNPTEELFYQLKGDIAIRLRPLDGKDPYEVIVREGEMFLIPRLVPHRPQRPADTIGLIVEFPRPADTKDKLQWFCTNDQHLVYEAEFRLRHIDEDLHIIMKDFWGGPVERRTCQTCETVIERAGEFVLPT